MSVVALGSATYWLGRNVIGVTGLQLGAGAAMCIGGALLVGPLLKI